MSPTAVGGERLLMVTNTPWTANLGGARVFVELAAELAALGCAVEKFSAEDAFPADFAADFAPDFAPGRGRGGGLRRWLARLPGRRDFARRARDFVRRESHRFDIIDAMQADLPYAKRDLGFRGLLVSRSVGLFSSYLEFDRFSARRWPEPRSPKRLLHRLLRYPSYQRALRRYVVGFRHADLINVSNAEDLAAVEGELGFAGKGACFPFGLTEARRRAFAESRLPPERRLAARRVAFIGTWNSRKGARDWPAIVRAVLAARPGVRFLLLGTDMERGAVLRDFPAELHRALEIHPRFDGEELPALLGAATVGAFPGYLEGFGFAVLEMLAAGLPIAAYDASGPREMLRFQRLPTVVPRGDTAAFAARLLELLALSPECHAAHGADGLAIAERFSWRHIAEQTLALYRERLGRLS